MDIFPLILIITQIMIAAGLIEDMDFLRLPYSQKGEFV